MSKNEVLQEMEKVYIRMLLWGATGEEKVYVPFHLKEVLGLEESICLAGKRLSVVKASEAQATDDIIIR